MKRIPKALSASILAVIILLSSISFSLAFLSPSALENLGHQKYAMRRAIYSRKGKSRGAPTWSVNMSDMNFCVEDTPMSYSIPIGPSFTIKLTYNSTADNGHNVPPYKNNTDTDYFSRPDNYFSPVGEKWNLNVNCYLVCDMMQYLDPPYNSISNPNYKTITVKMLDGRWETFKSAYGSDTVYNGDVDCFDKLEVCGDHNNADKHYYDYKLTSPNGTKYYYTRLTLPLTPDPYANLADNTFLRVCFLTSVEDRYGKKLTFNYDTCESANNLNALHTHNQPKIPEPTVHDFILKSIVDAQGRTTTFHYDQPDRDGNTYHITSIDDPFGRHVKFEYLVDESSDIDSSTPNGVTHANSYTQCALSKVTDMGGYSFEYTYSLDSRLLTLKNSQNGIIYNFDIPADGSTDTSVIVTYPDVTKADGTRDTVIKEKYWQGAKYYKYFYLSPQYYADGNSSTRKVLYNISSVGNKRKINLVQNPDGGYQRLLYDPVTGQQTQSIHTQAGSFNGNGTFSGDKEEYDYQYNGLGMPTQITSPQVQSLPQEITKNTYDANNYDVKLTQVSGIDNFYDPSSGVRMEYNGKHDITKLTDRDNKVTLYNYSSTPGSVGGQLTRTTATDGTNTYNYYYPTDTGTLGNPADGTPDNRGRLSQVKQGDKVLYSYEYDPYGRVRAMTNPAGVRLEYTYNNLDKVETITYPDGLYERYVYSSEWPDLVDYYMDRGGNFTHYVYDELKRLVKLQKPDREIDYAYDKNGNLTEIKLPPKNSGDPTVSTSFTYYDDGTNRVHYKKYPKGQQVEYHYNKAGSIDWMVTASNHKIQYGYNALDQLETKAFGNSTTVRLQHDEHGRLQARSDDSGTYTYRYDNNSRVKAIRNTFGNYSVVYGYDNLGRVNSIAPQGSDTVSYNYNAFGNLSSASMGGHTFRYSYQSPASPLPVSLTRYNGSTPGCITTYQYDAMKRLIDINNKKSNNTDVVLEDSFNYPGANLLPQHPDYVQSETVTGPDIPDINLPSANIVYSNNENNQLTNVSNFGDLVYDADGNMTTGYTQDGSPFSASYDYESRLTSISFTDASGTYHSASFTYDANDYIAKQIETVGAQTTETRFVRDGYLCLQERNSSNAVTRSYLWNPTVPGGIGGLLEMKKDGNYYDYLYDGKGNVSKVIDGSQNTVATYVYDPFGNLMPNSNQQIDQPYRFSTKPYLSGFGLYYFGRRFGSPILGRWINRDPLGEAGGLNLYAIAGNNTVNCKDPYGLAWSDWNLWDVPTTFSWDAPPENFWSDSFQLTLSLSDSDSMYSAIDYSSSPDNAPEGIDYGQNVADYVGLTGGLAGAANFVGSIAGGEIRSPGRAAAAAIDYAAVHVGGLSAFMGKYGNAIGAGASAVDLTYGVATAKSMSAFTALYGATASTVGGLVSSAAGGYAIGTWMYGTGYFDVPYALDYYHRRVYGY